MVASQMLFYKNFPEFVEEFLPEGECDDLREALEENHQRSLKGEVVRPWLSLGCMTLNYAADALGEAPPVTHTCTPYGSWTLAQLEKHYMAWNNRSGPEPYPKTMEEGLLRYQHADLYSVGVVLIQLAAAVFRPGALSPRFERLLGFLRKKPLRYSPIPLIDEIYECLYVESVPASSASSTSSDSADSPMSTSSTSSTFSAPPSEESVTIHFICKLLVQGFKTDQQIQEFKKQ